MTKQYRALRPDFVIRCKDLEVFEPAKHFKTWMAKPPNSGVGNEYIARLRDGLAVPAEIVPRLVGFALDAKAQGSQAARQALVEYCGKHGVSVTGECLSEVVDVISDVVDEQYGDPMSDATGFVESLCKMAATMGPDRLRAMVRPVLPDRDADPAPLRTAVEWICVELGRQNSRSKLGYDAARNLGEKHLGIPLEDYSAAVLSWSRKNPWSVTHALDHGKPIGVTIDLPLTADCYARIRNGRINSWDVRGRALEAPSQYVFMEAIAMVPHDTVTGPRVPTEPLFATMISQCAYLTSVPGAGETAPIHLLACGFAPVTTKRAYSMDFEPTGTCLAGTALPLMERVIHTAARIQDASLWGNWRALQLHLVGCD